MMKRAAPFLVASGLLLVAAAASAQNVVQLQGMLGRKALLVIDGGVPRIVAAGESVNGVKVISTSGDTAEIEIDGKRRTLHIGDAPSSVGSAASAPGSGTRHGNEEPGEKSPHVNPGSC